MNPECSTLWPWWAPFSCWLASSEAQGWVFGVDKNSLLLTTPMVSL